MAFPLDLPSIKFTPEVQRQDKPLCEDCQRIFSVETFGSFKKGKKTREFIEFIGVHKQDGWSALLAAAQRGCVLCAQAYDELWEKYKKEQLDNYEDLGSTQATPDRMPFYEGPLGYTFYTGYPSTLYFHFGYTFNSFAMFEGEFGSYYARSFVDDDSTGSQPALQLAKQWTAKLPFQHWSKLGVPIVPKRLIDIGEYHASRIRLINTSDIPAQSLIWCTLSHCWGQADFLRLTTRNMATLMKEILIRDLPLTFRQAIEVTRVLGRQYIWIDSLCIIQDEPDSSDWLEEGAKMHGIYKNAFCNIAATASKDSKEGLFRKRDLSLYYPIPIRFGGVNGKSTQSNDVTRNDKQDTYIVSRVSGDSAERALQVEPLNKRAWVYQERFMSPQILHFASTQLYHESGDYLMSETSPHRPLGSSRVSKFHATNVSSLEGPPEIYTRSILDKLSRDDKPKPLESYRVSWRNVVQTYMSCAITRQSDRLIAFSAFAQVWQNQTRSKYLAGLWRDHLDFDLVWLCWRLEGAPGLDKVTAPSWSWACAGGPVDYSSAHSGESSLIDIIDAKVDPVGDDDLGQVKGGFIELRGMITEGLIKRRYSGGHDHSLVLDYGSLSEQSGSEKKSEATHQHTSVRADNWAAYELIDGCGEAGMQCIMLPIVAGAKFIYGVVLVETKNRVREASYGNKDPDPVYQRIAGFEIVPRSGFDYTKSSRQWVGSVFELLHLKPPSVKLKRETITIV